MPVPDSNVRVIIVSARKLNPFPLRAAHVPRVSWIRSRKAKAVDHAPLPKGVNAFDFLDEVGIAQDRREREEFVILPCRLVTEYAPVIFPVAGTALGARRTATVHRPGTRLAMAGEVSIEWSLHFSFTSVDMTAALFANA